MRSQIWNRSLDLQRSIANAHSAASLWLCLCSQNSVGSAPFAFNALSHDTACVATPESVCLQLLHRQPVQWAVQARSQMLQAPVLTHTLTAFTWASLGCQSVLLTAGQAATEAVQCKAPRPLINRPAHQVGKTVSRASHTQKDTAGVKRACPTSSLQL